MPEIPSSTRTTTLGGRSCRTANASSCIATANHTDPAKGRIILDKPRRRVLRRKLERSMILKDTHRSIQQGRTLMARWLRWAGGPLLIAAGCALPLTATIAAPQTPAGEARIWFYRGYEPPSGGANYSPASIPTIVANGTYVGPAPSGSVF